MINPNGGRTWEYKGLDEKDGADITLQSIMADGTLGGRFTTANGWTVKNGKLPGLFGNTVDIPAHLLMPVITTENLSNGETGTAYNQTLAADGNTPITWSLASGNLPAGLTLAQGGKISGTPTASGTFTFKVKAQNSSGSDTKTLSIVITISVTITTTTLPNGMVNTAYSQSLTATGAAPITWTLASGKLPTGLTLSTTGTISGTPTTAGTFDFTVKATSSTGSSDIKALSMVIIENVGIVEMRHATSVQVFPNPVSDELQVKLPVENDAKYSIYNVMGNIVMQGKLSDEISIINVASLASGIYYLKISEQTIKFVKE
jgi:hypothetical protein